MLSMRMTVTVYDYIDRFDVYHGMRLRRALRILRSS